MYYLAPTYWQNRAIENLSQLGRSFEDVCTVDEWQELAEYMPLQFEGMFVYAACFTVPNFEMSEPDAKGKSTEAGERNFEATRESIDKLQI